MKKDIYEGRRKPFFYDSAALAARFTLHSYFQVSYVHKERLRQIVDGPCVVLPKHQQYTDIPLEGEMLRFEANRRAYFIMKGSLPGWLEYLGGIPIQRGKDVHNEDSREQRRRMLREAKAQREYVTNAMKQILENDDCLVIHPEGTRNKGVGYVNTPLLQSLIRVQERVGKAIQFLPVDIEYEGLLPFSRVTMTIGDAIQTSDASELEACIVNHIRLIEFSDAA